MQKIAFNSKIEKAEVVSSCGSLAPIDQYDTIWRAHATVQLPAESSRESRARLISLYTNDCTQERHNSQHIGRHLKPIYLGVVILNDFHTTSHASNFDPKEHARNGDARRDNTTRYEPVSGQERRCRLATGSRDSQFLTESITLGGFDLRFTRNLRWSLVMTAAAETIAASVTQTSPFLGVVVFKNEHFDLGVWVVGLSEPVEVLVKTIGQTFQYFIKPNLGCPVEIY